jgi:redox-sensitive bicupin YhaK (pirin superfamily)
LLALREEGHGGAREALGLLAQPRSERFGRGRLWSDDEVTCHTLNVTHHVTVLHRLKRVAVSVGRRLRELALMLNTDDIIEHVIAPNRSAWAQLARGAATLNGHAMKEGNGGALDDEDTVQVAAKADCEVLLFDLD